MVHQSLLGKRLAPERNVLSARQPTSSYSLPTHFPVSLFLVDDTLVSSTRKRETQGRERISRRDAIILLFLGLLPPHSGNRDLLVFRQNYSPEDGEDRLFP